MWHFVKTHALVAAASRKLADAVLSILIEWPPCYSSHVERYRAIVSRWPLGNCCWTVALLAGSLRSADWPQMAFTSQAF